MASHPTPSQVLAHLVADLQAAGELRTWSVIVSVFGDTALSRGSQIPASALGAILGPLGIEPGAMRTALSRLAKDHWIESLRSGRKSSYRLTRSALSASGVASQAIYAATRPVADTEPHLLLWPDTSDLPVDPRLLPLRRGTALWHGGAIPEAILAQALVATKIGTPVPDWVRTSVAPPDLAEHMHGLMARFTPLSEVVGTQSPVSPLEAVAARVLVIHAWRRMALRVPSLPAAFLPTDWPEPACRRFVLDLHSALSSLADPWLDAHLSGMPDEVA